MVIEVHTGVKKNIKYEPICLIDANKNRISLMGIFIYESCKEEGDYGRWVTIRFLGQIGQQMLAHDLIQQW